MQVFLYLVGATIGAASVGWRPLSVAVLAGGVCVPVALISAEYWIRQRVSCGVGPALSERARVRLMGIVAIATLACIAQDPKYMCPMVLFACLAGFGLEHLLASSRLAFWLIPVRRIRRHWAPVDVLSCHDDVATLRIGDGDIIVARTKCDVSLGAGYADIEVLALTYRVSGAAQVFAFETHKAREVRRALGQLAAVRFASGLMWGVVTASPFFGHILPGHGH